MKLITYNNNYYKPNLCWLYSRRHWLVHPHKGHYLIHKWSCKLLLRNTKEHNNNSKFILLPQSQHSTANEKSSNKIILTLNDMYLDQTSCRIGRKSCHRSTTYPLAALHKGSRKLHTAAHKHWLRDVGGRWPKLTSLVIRRCRDSSPDACRLVLFGK